MVAQLVAWWSWMAAVVSSINPWKFGRAGRSVDDLLVTLRRVERAQPAPSDFSHLREATERDRQDEATLEALRTHRAPRTVASVATTCRSIESFIVANGDRSRQAAACRDAWDRILEAWIVARVDPGRSRWNRPDAWRPRYDADATDKAAASWRAAMVRLRYAADAWPRSRSMAQAMASGPNEQSRRQTPPLFAWEILTGLRTRPPTSTWERGAAALLTVGMLSAGRRGNARRILLGNVTPVAEDAVSVVYADRPKPVRDRQVVAAGSHHRPVRLKHWSVRQHLIPWVDFLRKCGIHGTALLFPSLVRVGPRIVRTAVGRSVDGLWCEPLRAWSDRALLAAIRRFVKDPSDRTFQSIRVGNNIELRRARDVRDVTRRTLHGRTVKDLIGSEVAYHEVLAEDLEDATSRLGRLCIRRQPDGLLSCTATSASACEKDDWVATPGAAAFEAQVELESSDESEMDSDDTRVQYDCFRCGTTVRRSHHGFMCDSPGCANGTCVRCHPAGDAGALWCPRHDRRVGAV